MRILTPKRDTKTGELYHYCPLNGNRIGPTTCQSEPGDTHPRACPHLVQLEMKPTRYLVYCQALPLGDSLEEFDPPKAHDTYRGLSGTEVLQAVATHSWVEPKLDGARALVHLTPQGVFITSRRRNKDGHFNQFQDNVPHLRDHPGLLALGKLGYTILDGELIMPGDGDTLARTMGVVGSKPERAVAIQKTTTWAELYIFDIVRLNGLDISKHFLRNRHDALEELMLPIIQGDPYIHVIEHRVVGYAGQAAQLYAGYLDKGLEGCILKNPNAGYFDPQAWIKVKERRTFDCIITDFEMGAKGGKYESTLGSLKVSVIDKATCALREIAKVTPGDDALRQVLYFRLGRLDSRQITDLRLIVELEGQLLTKDGRVRHPRIVRWRGDRSEPNQVEFE